MNATGWRHGLWLLALLPAWIQAAEGPLVFSDPWIRAVPAGTPVMAGYVAIANGGTRTTRIAELQSQQFGAVEVHEMREVDGVMRMRPLRELQLDAGGTAALVPGGAHLMLFRPLRDLAPGERATIEFVLDDGSRQLVEFEVRVPQ